MAEKLLKMIIQLRNDTKANFEAVKDTLVLRSGECAVILDYTPEGPGFVVGDGVKTFAKLPVITAKSSGITGDNKTIQIIDGVASIYGFDATKKGLSFKVNADGTAIEWFEPVEQSKVDSLIQGLEQLKTNLDDNYYTKVDIDGKFEGVFKYSGTVANKAELEAVANPKKGEVYQVTEENKMYIFNGTSWDPFGVGIDTSNFVEKTEFNPIKVKVESMPQTLITSLGQAVRNPDNIVFSSNTMELQPDGTYKENLNENAFSIPEATATEAGLFGATDKAKLDGIGIATSGKEGLVKSGEGENKIVVLEDGTMEVGTISFDKLSQGTGDIILNGGGAAN